MAQLRDYYRTTRFLVEIGGGLDINRWVKTVGSALKENPQVRAVVVVLPQGQNEVDELYAHLKREFTTVFGIISQFVRHENIMKNHVFNGITRQLFTKLGVGNVGQLRSAACPWKVRFVNCGPLNLNEPTMLVGLDVNQNKGSSQSAVAMVSSFDRDFVQYHSQLEWQQKKQEVMELQLMKEMISTAMNKFENMNRRFPKKVILYRDGVADTQMDKIYRHEVEGIRQAFKEMAEENEGFEEPKLMYIIIQKRVNARFMYEENGQYFNVPLGTIVDDTVVSSQNWDWYCVPAEAPKDCTSTPTRYIVLVDDLNLGSDPEKVLAIESFTHQLCNLYFNWSGPVRVPSCVKNADKLSQQFGSKIGPKSNFYERIHVNLSNLYHYL